MVRWEEPCTLKEFRELSRMTDKEILKQEHLGKVTLAEIREIEKQLGVLA